MKICNLCMHVNHMTVTRCANCRQQDFTPLSESEIRERVPKEQRIKVARSAGRNQRSWRRRSFINNKRRDKSFWLKAIATVTAGSMVVTIGLNSTIWSSPDNPLDIRSFLQSQARIFGLTPLSTELRADVGDFVFVSTGGSCIGSQCIANVAVYNKGTRPIELPIESMCLRTDQGDFVSPISSFAQGEPGTPEERTFLVINPSSQASTNYILYGTGSQPLNGFWFWRDQVEILAKEIYYGECGHPERAWFRFDASVAVAGFPQR